MRLAIPVGLALLASFSLVVACAGGPGSVDQGGENGDQYGGVRGDTSRGRTESSTSSSDDDDEYTPPAPTTTTNPPNPRPPTSTSSTSSSSSG